MWTDASSYIELPSPHTPNISRTISDRAAQRLNTITFRKLCRKPVLELQKPVHVSQTNLDELAEQLITPSVITCIWEDVTFS